MPSTPVAKSDLQARRMVKGSGDAPPDSSRISFIYARSAGERVSTPGSAFVASRMSVRGGIGLQCASEAQTSAGFGMTSGAMSRNSASRALVELISSAISTSSSFRRRAVAQRYLRSRKPMCDLLGRRPLSAPFRSSVRRSIINIKPAASLGSGQTYWHRIGRTSWPWRCAAGCPNAVIMARPVRSGRVARRKRGGGLAAF